MEEVNKHSKNNSLKVNQNEKILISKRVEETKKDIDVLRDKLQELINTGLKKPEHSLTVDKNNENAIQRSEQHKVILKSYNLKHTGKEEKQEQIATKLSPNKNKLYDVEEARKYIRKQKEKRAEQAKLLNKVNNDADLRKQRLQELHKKSLDIVAKNVENKRERSKSRDRNYDNNELRLDKNVSSNCKKQPSQPRRSKSCEKNSEKLKTLQLFERKSLTTTDYERSHLHDKNKLEKHPNLKGELCKRKTNKLKTGCSKVNSILTTNDNIEQPIINENKIPLTIPEEDQTSKLIAQEQKVKSSNSELRIITQNITVRELHNNRKEPDKNEEFQAENTKFPAWLQENHSIQSNPHNFINTVKRKLNLAVNSPRITCDVGLQNSVLENRPVTPENNPKSLEELREIIQKSTKTSKPHITPLASFVSHQFQNLDAKSLQNFEIVANKNKKNNITSQDRDSESDTSKNIPDISSESGTSSKGNPESVKERDTKLNVNKSDSMNLKSVYTFDDLKSSSGINTLKSQLSNKSEKENSKNVNRKLFKDETDSYSSKFTLEKDDSSESSLKSSRNSIISFNVSKSKDRQNSSRQPSTSSIKTIEKYSSINKDIPILKEVLESETSTNSLKSIKNKNPIEYIPTSKTSTEKSIKSLVFSIPVSEQDVEDTSNKENMVNSPEMYSLLSSQTSKFDKNHKNNKSDQIPFQKTSFIEPLEEPKLILSTSKTSKDIHLKFEAEIHLLNDFNESLRQFSAVEKAFESLKTNNDSVPKLENKIIQTSFDMSPLVTDTSKNKSLISSINYSRGDLESNSLIRTDEDSFNISILLNTDNCNNKSVSLSMNEQIPFFNCENMPPNQCAGLSLIMFEQLIKDEDVKLENLKTILKIREKVLLDRTKSELTYLEIQRKHLKETGRLHEASLIKKKQRGILLKHQQEQHEMQRLKQMQKEASKERKIILKEQWKLIKSQLTTDNMISKIKLNTTMHSKSDRRKSGPLKVIQSQSESIHSDASVARSSFGEDVLSITSHSVISKVSEIDANPDLLSKKCTKFDAGDTHLDSMKRTLLMREAVLEKRRETAEELLQWHQKLLDEEKRISDLEQLANNIISTEQIKTSDVTNKHKFTGKELNQLWWSLTGSDEQKFIENKIYLMSQIALERFCKSAKEYTSKNKKYLEKIDVPSERFEDCSEKSATNNSNEYTLEFDGDSFIETNEMADIGRSQISSISQLIDNLSKIKEEISLISRKSKRSLRESITRENEKKHNFSSVQHEKKSLNEERQINNSILNSSEDVTTLETDKITEDIKSQCTILSENNETGNVNVECENGTDITTQDALFTEENGRKTDDIESLVNEMDSEQINTQISQIHSIDDKDSELKQKSVDISICERNDDTVNTDDVSLSQLESTKDMQEFILNVTEKNKIDSLQQKEIDADENETLEGTEDNKYDQEFSDILSTEKSLEESSKLIEGYSSKLAEDVINSSVNKSIEESVKKDLQLEVQDNSDTSFRQNSSIESQTNNSETNVSEIKTTADSSPKEISSYEEKEQDSGSQTSQKSNDFKKAPKTGVIDVKKRVSEIMADANQFLKSDKSSRLHDFYTTAYDIIPPASIDLQRQDGLKRGSKTIYGNEAEELLKKQLAIEKEIKQIEQQQKEQIPYVFMREIPNKPPPPYTPPSSLTIPNIITEVPTKPEEIDEITKYSAKILHKAYVSNNLDNVSISENTLNLITKKVGKECFKFVFNLCKELAQNHYNQFENGTGPSWLIVFKKSQLATNKPYDLNGLEKFINEKLKEIFKFKKTEIREKSIIKWSKKKRDHVDEILVFESQGEEMEWINYDKDELLVLDKVCNDIMNNLLSETANVFSNILSESII